MKTTFDKKTIPIAIGTKTLFSLIVLVSGSFSLQAQCSMTIPSSPGHVKISSSQTITATGTVYWVCEGVNLIVTYSPGSAFYLEKNATIKFLDSDGDAVWAKAGCVVTNNSIDVITVTCNPSTVTMANTGSGTIVPISCTSVTYVYSMVGSGPCVGTPGGINDYSEILPIRLYPNPVISSFTLSIDNDQNFKQFTFVLYNVLGEEVKRVEDITQNEIKFSREKLQSGIYIYQLLNENITVNRGKIVME